MYQPTNGRIVAKILPGVVKSESGFIIIDNTTAPQRAEVIAVGGSKLNKQAPCKPGDIVYYKKESFKSFEHEGQRGQREGIGSLTFWDITGVEKK